MNIPNHFYKPLKQFGNTTAIGAPVKFIGWLDTGVVDKHGQHVFEGDIVKVNGSEAGVIKLCDGAFSAGGWLLKNYTDGEIEVIGHIAEG